MGFTNIVVCTWPPAPVDAAGAAPVLPGNGLLKEKLFGHVVKCAVEKVVVPPNVPPLPLNATSFTDVIFCQPRGAAVCLNTVTVPVGNVNDPIVNSYCIELHQYISVTMSALSPLEK
jgi:hypothetical protein